MMATATNSIESLSSQEHRMMGGGGFQGVPSDSESAGQNEADLADPASSSIFMNDYKKHEDLRAMLDSNKDSQKLDAMKRIIGMVAKGKDASSLFPAVVKNVVSKNIEVKKLVYVYLTRYAEEKQDLALLSISTFQRALKDPNQLIRAGALRVLSSIRVPDIVPIMMLAIKEAVQDMSPYVRKTAAHAIPKLYSLDPEQKELLVEVIEKLLADKTILVAGSAIQAFEEVCPEKIELVHKNFCKLCTLLVDVEEWGQVIIVNMLTRYCRTQFIDPNSEGFAASEDPGKSFYSSSGSEDDADESKTKTELKKVHVMDPDHRLLLRNSKPLLNSRNAAVVIAVAQLYYHCAPRSEIGTVTRALIRLLHSHREVQYIVLSNIATMTLNHKGMFEPYLKSFYVRANDATHIKLLKLEILTNLGTETTISTILREFQTYVASSDKEFAAATIQAIGRSASSIAEIRDACLNGLVSLMSNRDEVVVGESVIVMKKLLQMNPSEHKEIIIQMSRMVEKITVPMAKASILWLIGEYCDRIPTFAPNVLRKMAKTFISEEDIVKLQILNLATKLCLTNPDQTQLLVQYVFNLAKYDQNYDIRDRARFLRRLVLPPEGKVGLLSKYAKKILLSEKPAPKLQSKFRDRDTYQLSTLSHCLNLHCNDYQPLPDWPEVAPDPSVRVAEPVVEWAKPGDLLANKPAIVQQRPFYSDDESSSGSSSSGSESGSEEESGSEASEADTRKPKPKPSEAKDEVGETESSTGSSSEESSTEASSEDIPEKTSKTAEENGKDQSVPSKVQQPQTSLLDLDDLSVGYQPTSAAFLQQYGNVELLAPVSGGQSQNASESPYASVVQGFGPTIKVKTHELLNRITGGGLSATYQFTRTMSIFKPSMVTVQITFTNSSEKPITDICIVSSKSSTETEMEDVPGISSLASGSSTQVTLGIDFKDTCQPAAFTLSTKTAQHKLSISAPVGDLLQPVTLAYNDFVKEQQKLGGMALNTAKLSFTEDISESDLAAVVLEVANVLQVIGCKPGHVCFAGKTMSQCSLVLVAISIAAGSELRIDVNCDKIVIGSMLLSDIKDALTALHKQ